jgi:hypothetical protein
MHKVLYYILSILKEIKTDSVANEISNIIALSMNLGFPNGIAIIPSTVIETKVIRVAR